MMMQFFFKHFIDLNCALFENEIGLFCLGKTLMISSLVLVGEAAEDTPGDHIATTVDSSECGHGCATLTLGRNLWEWVTIIDTVWVKAPTFVSTVRSRLILIGIELIVHQGLITVLKDRQVLEFFKENGDIVRWDKESGKEHEWNDQDRSQCHSELFVWERCGNDERVARTSIIDEDKNE